MNKRGKDGDAVCYGCPSCITSEAWNAYINAPFDQIARKAWVKTITFPCIDKTKMSDMAPPYGITYESVTRDLGNLVIKQGPRKVDVLFTMDIFLFLELYTTCHRKQKTFAWTNSLEAHLKWMSSTSLLGMGIIHGKLRMSKFMARIPNTLRWRTQHGLMDALANIKSFLLRCSWSCYTMLVSCFRKTKKQICSLRR